MNKLSDTFLSSVVKSIKKECLMKNVVIPTDRFVLTLVKVLLLNPEMRRFNASDPGGSKTKEKTIIKFTVDLLRMPNNPSVATLTLQIYFSESFTERDRVLRKRYEEVQKSVQPLLNLIHEKKTVKSKEDADRLYHYISCYAILISGIGDPSDSERLKEFIAILKSVLSSKELSRLVAKSISSKEKQIKDLRRIVTGIKIYNRDGSKKSEEVSDLPSTLGLAITNCYFFSTRITREVQKRVSSLIHQYMKLCKPIAHSFAVNGSSDDDRINSEIDSRNCHYFKSYVIFLHQLHNYFQTLNREIDSLNKDFQSCAGRLQQNLLRVRKTVKFRTAIPVVEIYPQFRDISQSWDEIQDMLVLSNYMSDICAELCKFFEKVPEPLLDSGMNSSEFEIQDVHAHDIPTRFIDFAHSTCEYVDLKGRKQFPGIVVLFGGFCPVTFVETNGLLVSGIREYGIIRYNNCYFCFASVEAMNQFVRKPEIYVERVKKLTFNWPETISLLGLKDSLEIENNKSGCTARERKQMCKKDAEVQTETHVNSSSLEYGYESNIWLMKKRRFRVANLSKVTTHSVQTDISTFRKDISVQSTNNFVRWR